MFPVFLLLGSLDLLGKLENNDEMICPEFLFKKISFKKMFLNYGPLVIRSIDWLILLN